MSDFRYRAKPVVKRSRSIQMGLTLLGQMNYRMPHGLWTIWQELPDVRVPQLPG